MRLNRYLAACGFGSRRACEELITGGEVLVNGEVCSDLATTIGEGDHVQVGKRVAKLPDNVYYVMNKPKGYITTAEDTHSRKTIFELLPRELGHLHYVGRLDMDSEGLLLLTNDGDLSHRLAHPSRGVEKEYEVTVEPAWDPKHAKRLLGGMIIEDKSAKFERIHQVGPNKLRIILHQGLKRQIRMMLLYVGYKVKSLVRIRIGQLTLEGLPRGSHRKLRPQEVKGLKILAGLIAGPPVKMPLIPVPRPAKPAKSKDDIIPPHARKKVVVRFTDGEDKPRRSAPGKRSAGPGRSGPGAGPKGKPRRSAGPPKSSGPRRGANRSR